MTPDETLAALDAYRRQIDEVDRRLVELLNQRARIAESIGGVKLEAGMRVYEPRREDAVYANVQGCNRGPLQGDALKRIYERIIDEMRTLQRDRMAQQKHRPDSEVNR